MITGTRAEFGLMRQMLHGLHQAPDVNLQIVVTGAHLVAAHGSTIDEIKMAGFEIDAEVDMVLASDTPRGVGQSIGLGIIGLTNALARLEPDMVVILGDRYEALAAAQSAMVLRIPIAHLHGGESTEGAIDEAIRHSITKMSHVHFTSAEFFRQKVIQMGEQPETVYNFGAVGLDNIASLRHISREDLEDFLGIDLNAPILLVTYHPLTLSDKGVSSVEHLLKSLSAQNCTRIIFTGANADALGQEINSHIQLFCAERPNQAVQVASLGVCRYLSLMAISDVVIGNSSSGLLEAPFLGVPTVNIGDRQKGRLRGPSVVDCTDTTDAISKAIAQARTMEMKLVAARKKTPYGNPGASAKIVEVLRAVELDGILFKRFHTI